MYIELKEKWRNLKEIKKTLLTPKRIILMVWLSILPVGIALTWKEIVKIWKRKRTTQSQTKLTDWEASKEKRELKK
jgi:hypothetical protein